MRGRYKILAGAAGAALIGGAVSALAQETTAYRYDELGRLIGSTISGGGNNGRQIATCFDPAGNRVRYDVATSAPALCPGQTLTPTPTPTPTPPPANQPPVAVNDSATFNCSLLKTLDVIANDSDPENNTPLSVVSVTPLDVSTWASVVSSTSVQIGSESAGTFTLQYVVSDSLGAISTGAITINVTGSECGINPSI